MTALDLSNYQSESVNLAGWKQSLPGLCFNSSGGNGPIPENLSMAWQLFMDAGLLLDSIEDQDSIGLIQMRFKKNELLNGAIGILLLAYYTLDIFLEEQKYDSRSREIKKKFHQIVIEACGGQSREFSLTNLSVAQWWEIAAAKSGGPYSLACWVGARMATRDRFMLTQIEKYGYHLGLIIQLLDDARDFLPLVDTDLENSHYKSLRTLPISFALDELPSNSRTRLEDLLPRMEESKEVVDEIFEIVNNCGASLYLETEIEKHRSLAKCAIVSDKFLPPAREELISILDKITQFKLVGN